MMAAKMATAGAPPVQEPWWQARWFLALALLLIAMPLIWPDVPPLTDLPSHMGRYKIAIDLGNSPSLQTFFEFRWSLIPNLGVDLLMVPMAKLFGIELGAKIIVLLIPPLTLAGFLWTAREAHGELPPTWLFAAPLIYNESFLYGFVNFALAAAIAFLALGLWMRLGRLGRKGLRAAIFLPLSLLLWVTHAFGWGMFGLLAFGVEFGRETEREPSIWRAAVRASLQCVPLAIPLLPMLIWQGETEGGAGDWFNLRWKASALAAVLRDRWFYLDVFSAGLLWLLLFAAVRDRRLQFARSLAFAALLLAAAFILLPRLILGAAHNDDRLAPYFLAVALLGVGPAAWMPPRFVRMLALAGLAFFLVRTGGATASAWLYDRSFDAELQAMDKIPPGARVAAFVGMDCRFNWGRSRLEHVPSLAIVRKEAFANSEWTVAGSHLLKVKPPWTPYVDPSQMIFPAKCSVFTLEKALATVTPDKFDYVWLIQPPAFDPSFVRSWKPVWRRGSSALYAVPHKDAPAT